MDQLEPGRPPAGRQVGGGSGGVCRAQDGASGGGGESPPYLPQAWDAGALRFAVRRSPFAEPDA